MEYTYCSDECDKCYPKNSRLLIDDELAHSPIYYTKDDSTMHTPIVESKTVDISNMSISAIFCKTISYMNIIELDVSNNPIKWLPEIASLEILRCNNCNIMDLPVYLPNLKELECENNIIKKLPQFNNLRKLHCSKNLITHIPYKKIQVLKCNQNPITSINIQTLTYLEATDCPILVIHHIPSLYKHSSVLIDHTLKKLMVKREKINKDFVQINWHDRTISDSLLKRLMTHSTISKVCPFLFKN